MKKFISEFIPITEKIDKNKLEKDGYEITEIGKFYRLRKLIGLEAINNKYRKMKKFKKNLTKKQRCQYEDNVILFSIYIIVFSLLIFAVLFKVIHYLI